MRYLTLFIVDIGLSKRTPVAIYLGYYVIKQLDLRVTTLLAEQTSHFLGHYIVLVEKSSERGGHGMEWNR